MWRSKYLNFMFWEIDAVVGLIESLMTLTLTDEITETRVDRTGEFLGQGATNAVTEFFGGMGRMCHDWTTHD